MLLSSYWLFYYIISCRIVLLAVVLDYWLSYCIIGCPITLLAVVSYYWLSYYIIGCRIVLLTVLLYFFLSHASGILSFLVSKYTSFYHIFTDFKDAMKKPPLIRPLKGVIRGLMGVFPEQTADGSLLLRTDALLVMEISLHHAEGFIHPQLFVKGLFFVVTGKIHHIKLLQLV